MFALSLLLFLLFNLIKNVVGGEEYLYKVMDPNDYFPVKEYVAPEGHEHPSNSKEYVPPAFLTDPTAPNRVVEYYAPWCPHCQHFKEHYIAFARNCTDVSRSHNVDIEFHAVSCTANKPVCKNDKDIHGYPTIKLFPAGNSTGMKLASYASLHCFKVLNSFGVRLNGDEDVTAPAKEESSPKSNIRTVSDPHPLDLSPLKQFHKVDYQKERKTVLNDAFLSFDFAMRQSIFMTNGPLTNHTQEVFEEWIELLGRALPPTWKIHDVLDSILYKMEDVVKSEAILTSIMDSKGPSLKQWSDKCGYTCGLWRLFHVMTVGLVEWNTLATTENAVVTATKAADLLRDYISEFFACEVCRTHFVQEYDSCAFERCSRLGRSRTDTKEWRQLPLWLWESHNAVNVRLMHERAEREGRPSADDTTVMWPSREDCPGCWRTDGSWDDEVMYRYLRLFYWPFDDKWNRDYAREVALQIERTGNKLQEDDDSTGNIPNKIVSIGVALTLTGIFIMFLIQILQNLERKRTGRHKKIDPTS
jgi:thiol-disulfide isomerase/thioredoxin